VQPKNVKLSQLTWIFELTKLKFLRQHKHLLF